MGLFQMAHPLNRLPHRMVVTNDAGEILGSVSRVEMEVGSNHTEPRYLYATDVHNPFLAKNPEDYAPQTGDLCNTGDEAIEYVTTCGTNNRNAWAYRQELEATAGSTEG